MRRSSLTIPVIAGAVAIAPLLFGVPQGDDWFIELVRVQEYQRAWSGGDILPTWAPEVLNGFGSRDFLYFPPLFPASAASLASLTGSIGSGVIVTLAAVTLGGMWAMHRAAASVGRLLRVSRPEVAADIAAAAYGLAPFLVFDRIVRNSFAEVTALAVLPLGVWAAAESRERPLRASVLAAIAVTGVVLSHLLTVAIGAVAVLVVLTLIGPARADGRPLLAGAVAGLSVTAWFWVPLAASMDSVRLGELTGYGLASADNVLPIADQLWPGDVALGPGMVIVALATLALARGSADRETWRWAAAGAVIAVALTVLTSPAATGLWEIETLAVVQFPWRLWSLHAVVGSLALGVVACQRVSTTAQRLAVTGIIVISAAVPLSRLATVDSSWSGDVENLLASNDLPYQSTIGYEYLPPEAGLGVWLTHDPADGPILDVIGGTVTEIRDETYRIAVDIESEGPAAAFVAVWDVPEWTVTGAARRFASDGGALGLGTEGGNATIIVAYEAPALRRTLERATPLVVAAWMGAAVWFRRRRTSAGAEQ